MAWTTYKFFMEITVFDSRFELDEMACLVAAAIFLIFAISLFCALTEF